MREWLTIIIVLLIVGILLDGIRRMRAYRKHSIRMSRDIGEEGNSDDVPSSEFPGGGARVVAYRDPSDVDSITQNARENYAASRQTKGSKSKLLEREEVSPSRSTVVENNEQPPTESVIAPELQQAKPESDLEFSYGANSGEPSLGNLNDLDDLETELNRIEHVNYAEPPTPVSDDLEPLQRTYESPITERQADRVEVVSSKPLPSKPSPSKPKTKPENTVKAKKRDETPVEAPKAPDLVLVINVMARRGEVFSGPHILETFLNNGLRFGEMDIFHRHETVDGKGKVLFSLANIVMPGVFDLSEMSRFETPGFSMFLSLPISGDSLEVYELMADTAQGIALDLGGELKDEQRSVMTRQTIEHDRQRVIEYERQKRLERA